MPPANTVAHQNWWRTCRIPQDARTASGIVRRGNLSYRYAFSPSSESLAGGGPGQDYLVFSERNSPPAFAFAICDGVSQSFYGNVGSQFLGDALVSWLCGLSISADATTVEQSLAAMLEWSRVFGQAQFDRQALPADLPALTREVMQVQRAQGSESMFICGRIDEPCHAAPSGRIVLAWMGDSRLRLWGRGAPDPADIEATLQTRARWSSRVGVIGAPPNVLVRQLTDSDGPAVTRVMVYSDGLRSVDEKWVEPVSNNAVCEEIDASLDAPDSDDISYLEVWIAGAPEVDHTPASLTSPPARTASLPAGQVPRDGAYSANQQAASRIRLLSQKRLLILALELALLLLGLLLLLTRSPTVIASPAPAFVISGGPCAI